MSSTRHRSRATRQATFPRCSGDEDKTALLDHSKSEENIEVAFVRVLEVVNALDLKAASEADDVALESTLSSLWERTLCKTPQFHLRDGRSLIRETEWNQWREALTHFTLPSLLRHNSVRVQGALACVFLESLRISAPKVPFDEATFRVILDLCIRVLDGLNNVANDIHDQEGTLASSGGGLDAPTAVAASDGHTDSVHEGSRWSLRLLERISKTKVFALATAQQVGSLIGCLMSAAHHNTLNYRSKMQIVEVIVSTVVEQAHEADPWTGSANTITHVMEQILAPLTAQSPTQLGRSSFGQNAELETTGMSSWRFGARHVAEQVLQRAADSLQGPVAAYLREISTEKRHVLIEILYRVAPSVLQYVLPNLSTESRVNDPQSRLRCVQLIANLFVHHFASVGGRATLFHDPNAIDRSLFLDLLERFQDVDPNVRAGAVRAVQELLVWLYRHISDATLTAKVSVADPKGASTLPRPLPVQMLQDLDRHLQDRLLDQDERVRIAAVQTVFGSDARSSHTSLCVVSSLPLAGVAALSRVRDKRSAVRNCTIQMLARLYRVFMQWPCERQESTDARASDRNASPPAFVREWIIQLVRELLASYIQLTQVACTATVATDEMLGSVIQIELLFYDARAVAAGCLSLWREALNKDGAQRINRSFGVHGWTAFPANDALRLMMRARTHFQNDMRALLDMRDALRQRRRLSGSALSSEAAAVLERLSSSLGSPTVACGPECDSSAAKLLLDVMQLRDERIFQNMRSLLNGAWHR
ncbi:hypothetical protein F1559_003847 [Cyanidiococcus yangmingshanensis]|uniref:Uncharacterized protein n=1 Tax=Cyanidiococcus yangmingshanensis TaxID=2690220 RepID=A0A7J7IMH4_9RHOD|nr:hypothetical protein F1559_003847 [Cyanidiococcus yangmingshanensis]